jgi:hypothetical protein
LPGTLYVTDVVWVLWFTGWFYMVESTSGLYVQTMLSGILLSECDNGDGVYYSRLLLPCRFDVSDWDSMFNNMSNRSISNNRVHCHHE